LKGSARSTGTIPCRPMTESVHVSWFLCRAGRAINRAIQRSLRLMPILRDPGDPCRNDVEGRHRRNLEETGRYRSTPCGLIKATFFWLKNADTGSGHQAICRPDTPSTASRWEDCRRIWCPSYFRQQFRRGLSDDPRNGFEENHVLSAPVAGVAEARANCARQSGKMRKLREMVTPVAGWKGTSENEPRTWLMDSNHA